MKICALDGCENEVVGRADRKFCSEACRKENHYVDTYLNTSFTSTDVDSFWAGRLCADWQSRPLIQV